MSHLSFMIKGDLNFCIYYEETSFLYFSLVNKKNKEKFVNVYSTTDAGILNITYFCQDVFVQTLCLKNDE